MASGRRREANTGKAQQELRVGMAILSGTPDELCHGRLQGPAMTRSKEIADRVMRDYIDQFGPGSRVIKGLH